MGGTLKILRAKVDSVRGATDPSKVTAINQAFEAESPARFATATLEQSEAREGEKERLLRELRPYAETGLRERGFTPGGTWVEYLAKFSWAKGAAREMVGMEPRREAQQDAEMSRIIEEKLPGVADRVKEAYKDTKTNLGMRRGVRRTNFIDAPLEGAELGQVINGMTPEERATLVNELKAFAAKPTVPAPRPRAGGATARPGGPAGAPTTGPAAMNLRGLDDGRLVAVNETGNRLLRDIRDSLQGGNSRGYIGPLTVDGADSGPRRS